jgi:hypothetical protein
MKSLHDFGKMWWGVRGIRPVEALICLAVGLAIAHPASAQVKPAGDAGGWVLSAGGTDAAYVINYGDREMLGFSGFVEADTKRRLGIEAEGRWLIFNQTANVHTTTYEVGPRYHMDFGKLQPYVKGMVGIGEFNFPYNLATGNYLVIAPGGGLDYYINRRFQIRIIDAEYQIWPQFTFGSLSQVGISSGIRVRIF